MANGEVLFIFLVLVFPYLYTGIYGCVEALLDPVQIKHTWCGAD